LKAKKLKTINWCMNFHLKPGVKMYTRIESNNRAAVSTEANSLGAPEKLELPHTRLEWNERVLVSLSSN
jgi:hypothetical protein